MAHVSQTYSIDEKNPGILPRFHTQFAHGNSWTILSFLWREFGRGEESWRTAFYEKEYKLNLNYGFDIKKYSAIFRYTPYESLKIFLSGFNTHLTKRI